MTDETRSWTQLRDDNVYLKEQIKQLRITTAKKPVESDIDLELTYFMFQRGITHYGNVRSNRGTDDAIQAHAKAIEAWKARQK